MAASHPNPVSSVRDRVSEEEWQVRVDLAAAYRLVAAEGWDDLVFTHISARVPGGHDHFLVNPYGMLFEEITASSLVKVDLEGRIVLETPYAINPAGFTIHSAVHAAREDAGCVMHLHTNDGIAVSAQAGEYARSAEVLRTLLEAGAPDESTFFVKEGLFGNAGLFERPEFAALREDWLAGLERLRQEYAP